MVCHFLTFFCPFVVHFKFVHLRYFAIGGPFVVHLDLARFASVQFLSICCQFFVHLVTFAIVHLLSICCPFDAFCNAHKKMNTKLMNSMISISFADFLRTNYITRLSICCQFFCRFVVHFKLVHPRYLAIRGPFVVHLDLARFASVHFLQHGLILFNFLSMFCPFFVHFCNLHFGDFAAILINLQQHR